MEKGGKLRQDTQTTMIFRICRPGKGRFCQIFVLALVLCIVPNSVTTILTLSARSAGGDMTDPKHIQAIYGQENVRISQGPCWRGAWRT